MSEKRLSDCTKEELESIVKGLLYAYEKMPTNGLGAFVNIPEVHTLLNRFDCDVWVRQEPNSLVKQVVTLRR